MGVNGHLDVCVCDQLEYTVPEFIFYYDPPRFHAKYNTFVTIDTISQIGLFSRYKPLLFLGNKFEMVSIATKHEKDA